MSEQRKISARRVVLTSFLVDISDVVLNLTIAILSGSVIMLSQVLQGVSDLAASGLLIIGVKRSSRPATRKLPFGYGKELFFWTLLASLVMFSLTAMLSFYLGWQRFISPEPLENISLAYAVLSVGVFTNGYSFSLSFRRLLGGKSPKRIWQVFFQSTLVETKATFALDLMGTLAALIGLASLLVFGITGNLRFDGLGAMLIGIMLAILALSLLIAVKDLLVGQAASPEIEKKIKEAVLEVPGVEEVLDLRTMIIGSERILVNIEVHLIESLTTSQIEKIIDKIKQNIQEDVSSAKNIQVELETPDEELT